MLDFLRRQTRQMDQRPACSNEQKTFMVFIEYVTMCMVDVN